MTLTLTRGRVLAEGEELDVAEAHAGAGRDDHGAVRLRRHPSNRLMRRSRYTPAVGLAGGAVDEVVLGERHVLQARAAPQAGLAVVLVHRGDPRLLVGEVRVDPLPGALQRLAEHRVGGVREAGDLLLAEGARAGERREARRPHDVAGVGAPDAGHPAAVAQRRVQHPRAGEGLPPPLGRPGRSAPGPSRRQRAVPGEPLGVEHVGRRAALGRELAQAQHLAPADVEVEVGLAARAASRAAARCPGGRPASGG